MVTRCRYLAGLSQDSLKLSFFNFKDQKWSQPITENGGIGFPTWSRDGNYLYFNEGGCQPDVSSHQSWRYRSETLFTLRNIRLSFSNIVGEWSGLSPDGFPLFTRDISAQEIYALDVELPQF
jgi:hypothetical protein